VVRAAGWGLALLLAWLVAYPLVLVALDAVRTPDGAWSLEAVRAFLDRPTEGRALWGSTWLSLVTVAGCALVGVPAAWLVERTDVPGRRWLDTLFLLPAVLPPLVGVLALLFLAGESGFAAHLVRAVTGADAAPWRLEGAAAILLVHVHAMAIYFYVFTRAGLRTLDPALLEAAAVLGGTRLRVWRSIVLPHLRPALTGAALVTFMTSLASFSAPYLFGGPLRVMTTQIVATRLNGDYALAMTETLALAALALAALVAVRVLDADEPPRPAGKGVAAARRAMLGPVAKPLAAVAAWTLALAGILPHLTLLVISLVPRGTWTTEAVPPVLSLGNYVALVTDPVRARPLLNSLWMGALAALAATALSVAAAWLAVGRRVPARRWIEALLALPWAVPGTVFAIALATTFSVQAPWTGRVILVGTVWLLPLAYIVRALPLAGRGVSAAWRRLDPALDDAAAVLGASPWRTLREVTLPLLRPAVLAAGALAFVTGFGDFVASIVLYTYDTRPVSLEILGSLRQSDVGVAAAYGVVLMCISALVLRLGRAEAA
jgi:iron(III) transport system permease protein